MVSTLREARPLVPRPQPHARAFRTSMAGSRGPWAPWAGARWCTWTIAWCALRVADVAEVLEIFRRRQLCAKSSKCEFGRQELGFLGHRLSKAGVSVDPRKVQSIVEWATPTSCAEVRRFTGLASYCRRFVEGYSELAAPLTALSRPTARFTRTAAAQESFDALKQALS